MRIIFLDKILSLVPDAAKNLDRKSQNCDSKASVSPGPQVAHRDILVISFAFKVLASDIIPFGLSCISSFI